MFLVTYTIRNIRSSFHVAIKYPCERNRNVFPLSFLIYIIYLLLSLFLKFSKLWVRFRSQPKGTNQGLLLFIICQYSCVHVLCVLPKSHVHIIYTHINIHIFFCIYKLINFESESETV